MSCREKLVDELARGKAMEKVMEHGAFDHHKDVARIYQNGGSPVRTSVLERKKETADVELSRLLRKPGKRNGAGFF